MSTPGIYRHRDLPHWDVPGAIYFVTACLDGSIPAQGLLDIASYRTNLARRPRPAGKTPQDWMVEQWKQTFVRTERWLDQESAIRYLADPQSARIVYDALYFFSGRRYDLLAFAIMPSHFHWVFQPIPRWVEGFATAAEQRTPRERIMHSIKRYTASECNKRLQRLGSFWQAESYDHWVRDVDELERIIHYIEQNPVKAGLVAAPEQWEFSSARDRLAAGIELGVPLPGQPRWSEF